MARLLLLSCSQKKLPNTRPIPAINRYDGPHYRVIKKAMREGLFPESIDVLILSAKYGLLEPQTPIDNYDLRMTSGRALQLKREVGATLDQYLKKKNYSQVFINMGKVYCQAFSDSMEIVRQRDKILYAQGGIGSRSKAMKEWILAIE